MNKPTEALILAGGLGTRLRQVVADVPKPMADINGKPFLAYLIDYWIEQDISRFVLSIGYKGEFIEKYFGESYNGTKIEYICEESPLGTGGAVKQALDRVPFVHNNIILINGDTWFEADLQSLSNAATRNRFPITMILKNIENNDRYGGVLVDNNNQVTDFTTSTGGRTMINSGCYLLTVDKLKELLKNMPEKFSFEEDVLKPFAKKGFLAADIQEKTFLDIGIPEAYAEAVKMFGK